MKLIILGPQGSGKGTQAKLLSEKLNISHISVGDILRQNIQAKTELGKIAANYINDGNLVPDKVIIDLIKNRLAEADVAAGFILDGYPRTLPQARALDEIVDLDQALEVWIPDEEAISRISKRRICIKCGDIFHLEHNLSKKPDICDNCHGELIIRDDDQPQAIEKRLAAYHLQTEPLIDYYKSKGIYFKIDGRPSIEEVRQDIFQKLNLN